MKQDELINIYNEIEYNWQEYNRINEILNNEKEYIKNYDYKKNKFKIIFKTIKNFVINFIFKILIFNLSINILNQLFNIINIFPGIITFSNAAIISYSLITEIISNKKIYKNLNERMDNELLEKMEYIEDLSTKKIEVRKKIYDLSDIIKLNNNLSNEENEQEIPKVQENSIEENIMKAEPYIEYKETAKVLKKKINKSKNKRSSHYE